MQKTEEICRAAESSLTQMKVVSDNAETTVSTVNVEQNHQGYTDKAMANSKSAQGCENCGRKHEEHRRELFSAYGKVCNECLKQNHTAVKCHSCSGRAKLTQRQIQAIDEDDSDKVFPTQISAVNLDDPQLVTGKLESGNFLCFQVDTGAQCNIIPLELYKKVSRDFQMTRVILARTTITAYGGTTLSVAGSVILHVWRGDHRCKMTASWSTIPASIHCLEEGPV